MKIRVLSVDVDAPQRGFAPIGDRPHWRRISVNLTDEEWNTIKGRDIDVTIEPVKSREERLREARIAGLKEFWRTTSMSGSYDESKIIAVIERADAEFAKGEK